VGEGFFGASQPEALDALRRWLEAGHPAACVVHGPAGAGKSTVVDRFWRSLEAADLHRVLVRVGPLAGVAFEHGLLAALAAGLSPGDSPPADDPRALRTHLCNRIAEWNPSNEDEPLILGLIGPDACSDWPPEPGASVLHDLGSSARVVVTISGPRSVAETWALRLGLHLEQVAWVPVDGFRLEDIDVSLRDHLAWAALDGPGPLALAQATEHALRLAGAQGLVELSSILAQASSPIDAADAAPLLGFPEAEVRAWIEAHRAALEPMLVWGDAGRAIRFRHEALRSAWASMNCGRAASWVERLADAARRLVRAAVEGRASQSDTGGYLRRHAGDHLLSAGAPPADLLALCEPGWAWPSSWDDLAARRAELRRVRRTIARPLEGSADASFSADAAPQLVRVALSQGALGTVHRTWDDEEQKPRAGSWNGAEPALAVALLALAAHASGRLREDLLARAVELARRGGAAWRDAPALLAAARAASEADAATFARRAASAARDAEAGPDTPRWLTAASFLPCDEAAALVDEAIHNARSSPTPGRALALLAAAEGLSPDQALALARAAMALPPPARANALAPLLAALPDAERERARSAVLQAYFDDADVEGEILDYAACTEALVPSLSEGEITALLADPMTGMGEPLAARLAALGHAAPACDVIEQLCGGGIHGARALLRAAAAAGSGPLVEAARAAVASLEPAWHAATLVRDQAAAAIQVLGLQAAAALADRAGDDLSHHVHITALAALCRAAPEEERPSLAARAFAAYREDRDTDSLESVVACAPWLSLADAAWLFATSLGDAAGTVTLVSTLRGWGGVEQLAPLVSRIGGDEAIAAVADALRLAVSWMTHESAAA